MFDRGNKNTQLMWKI